MNAVSAGSSFHETGVEYLNSDDYFIAQERKERSTKYEIIKAKKDKYEDYQVTKTEDQRVIQDLRTSKNKYAYNDGEATDLKVSDLKILYKWKHGKNPKAGLNKVALCDNWIDHKDNTKSEVSKWTQEKEAELETLSSETVELDQIELGKQKKKVLNNTLSIIMTMTENQLRQLRDAINTPTTEV